MRLSIGRLARCLPACAALAVATSTAALGVGHASGIPLDPPGLLVQEAPGATSFAASFSLRDARFTLSRSVGERFDVAAVVTTTCPFDLRLRTLLFRDLVPLRVEVELGLGGALLLSSVRLGPVHVDVARSWGDDDGGWGVVRWAPRVDVGLVVGARFGRGAVAPVAGFWWRPVARALWNVSALFDGTALRAVVGGVERGESRLSTGGSR